MCRLGMNPLQSCELYSGQCGNNWRRLITFFPLFSDAPCMESNINANISSLHLLSITGASSEQCSFIDCRRLYACLYLTFAFNSNLVDSGKENERWGGGVVLE